MSHKRKRRHFSDGSSASSSLSSRLVKRPRTYANTLTSSRNQTHSTSFNEEHLISVSETPPPPLPKKMSTKRETNNNNIESTSSQDDNELECPICYEDFMGHIYQCCEGHLLCQECKPKFEKCPICNVPLSNIRNRALEKLISMNNHKSQSANARNTRKQTQNNKMEMIDKLDCNLCYKRFIEKTQLISHIQTCDHRNIKCPFTDCKWKDKFNKFVAHTQTAHHACVGPIQTSDTSAHNQYKFNHAIKFPPHTFKRENADFVWPKLVKFKNITFFVLTRYHKDHISVLLRLWKLSDLTKEDIARIQSKNPLVNGKNIEIIDNENDNNTQIVEQQKDSGNYFIEIRLKQTNHASNNNTNQNRKYQRNPVRWPGKLYGIAVPFAYEEHYHEIMRIHKNVFCRYWTKTDDKASAVLRFQFEAFLSLK